MLIPAGRDRAVFDAHGLTEIGGVTFAPDGRVWIGDAGSVLDHSKPQGLWFAPTLDTAAVKLSNGDYPVQCLGYQQATETLYACQQQTFGRVDVADGSFDTMLDFHAVEGFVECPGVDMAATCKQELCDAWCGRGHFAEASVCCAYDTLTCGPAVAPSAICPANAGGMLGAGGASPGAGGTPAASGGIAGSGAGGSVSTHEAGCCAIAGRARRTDPVASIAIAVTTLALRRRRHTDTCRKRWTLTAR